MSAEDVIMKALPSDDELKDKTWADIMALTKASPEIWKKVATHLGDEDMEDFNDLIMITVKEFSEAFTEADAKPVQKNRTGNKKRKKKHK